MQRIGIIGLGAMGRPMARHLIAKGFTVCGCDPAAPAREQAAALGVAVVASPAEVARASDLVLIVVGFDAQVEKVFFAEQGLLSGSRAGLIVAMGSTIAPSYARRLAERVKSHGLVLLDMALTRGEPAAEAGQMLILGGGDKTAFETCRPVFSTFASDIFNLGPFGAGQVGKMVNNLILWSCMAANDEGLHLGEALGVDQETMRAALVHSSAQKSILGEFLEFLLEFSLSTADDRSKHHYSFALWQTQNVLHDLVDTLPSDGGATHGAMWRAD